MQILHHVLNSLQKLHVWMSKYDLDLVSHVFPIQSWSKWSIESKTWNYQGATRKQQVRRRIAIPFWHWTIKSTVKPDIDVPQRYLGTCVGYIRVVLGFKKIHFPPSHTLNMMHFLLLWPPNLSKHNNINNLTFIRWIPRNKNILNIPKWQNKT